MIATNFSTANALTVARVTELSWPVNDDGEDTELYYSGTPESLLLCDAKVESGVIHAYSNALTCNHVKTGMVRKASVNRSRVDAVNDAHVADLRT